MSSINPLASLSALGQSPWFDFISSELVASGKLRRLVEEDLVGGVTSNPAIFEKAIASGTEYEAALRALAADPRRDANAIYEALAIADIQAAADVMRPVYDRTAGRDGFVSLEVSPYLAHDMAGTIDEARRLAAAVARPNLMIKVPGTAAGVDAIRTLIDDGISINVTLLFALDAYIAVAEAYADGLEMRLRRGETIDRIGSVASFFVSRIDSMIDKKIDTRVAARDAQAVALQGVRGKVAIANAKLAYKWFEEFSASPRWQALAAKGAAPQRLLWASTGTKDPSYPDTLYVDTLIGADTVNTMPPATMDAFRDHGTACATLADDYAGAEHVLNAAARLGLDLPGVTSFLVADGVKQFAEAADRLLSAVEMRRAASLAGQIPHVGFAAPAAMLAIHNAALAAWQKAGNGRRLFARDPGLWTSSGEENWLDWLDAPAEAEKNLAEYKAFAADLAASGFTDILLLGMGGSSLGPEVIGAILGGIRKLHVLDSTEPSQVSRVVGGVDFAHTLVITASKSGTTLEPSVMEKYVWAQDFAKLGDQACKNFVAITDPGSALEKLALAKKYRRIFHGNPKIGGRFSVLSPFGFVVAAAIGADLDNMLDHAQRGAAACAGLTPAAVNAGAVIGIAMAESARAGRNKLTLLLPEIFAPFGAWLEQLIAESTGKQGKLILPIDAEENPGFYGSDRIFADFTIGDDSTRSDALVAAGHPVLRIKLTGKDDLAGQFYVWEIATAIAGSILQINPFDQPDVESAKIRARAITDRIKTSGALPPLPDAVASGDILLRGHGASADLAKSVRSLLGLTKSGDYLAILAYLDQTPKNTARLNHLRKEMGRMSGCPTLLQFGPRFLHSTGQGFKGGPESCVFLMITADPAQDVEVPHEMLSFGQIIAAQARGDYEVLAERDRRILHLHIAGNEAAGIGKISTLLDPA